MKLFALLSLIALVVLGPAHAQFLGRGVTCPYTGSSSDGCAGAPGYINSALSFQVKAAFSDGTLFQNGQMPSGGGFTSGRNNNITWNAAGIDYAVGVTPGTYCNGGNRPCSTASGASNLIDANAYFTLIGSNGDPAGTGCGPTSTYTAGVLNCKPNNAAVVFNGFDFSPIIGGTQTCIPVVVSSTAGTVTAGTMTLKNSRYLETNNSACYISPTLAAFRLGTTSTNSWAFDVENNYIDLASKQPFMFNQLIFAVWTNGTGSSTFKYNLFANSPTKALDITTCGPLAINFNAFHNDGYDYGHNLHTEFEIVNGINTCAAASQSVSWNLAWQDTDLRAPPTAFIFDDVLGSSNTTPPSITNGDYTNNVIITNRTTDGAGTLSWYSVPAGDVYPLTALGSGYSVNDVVSVNVAGCRILPSFKVLTIGGGGALIASGAGMEIVSAGSCLGASHPSTSTVWSTSGGTGTGATTATPTWLDTTASQGMGFGTAAGQSYTNLNISSNLIDTTGLLSTPISNGSGTVTCANPMTFSNNFNMLTNSALSTITPTSGC